MKIAGIIFGLIAVGLIVYAIIGGNKGWQGENEVDPTKMPTKDDMEREDKKKSTGRFLSLLFLFLPVFGFSQWGNCEIVEKYSDWMPLEERTLITCDTLVTHIHRHDWAYANHDDVNNSPWQTTLINCAPCPCGSTATEARICRGCKFHQTRTRTTAYSNQESEYIRLLKEKEGQ